MSEENIVNMLLEISSQNDQTFKTKLQSEVLNKVAKNITDLIYESIQHISSDSSVKRGNLLKFLTSLTETKKPHSLINVGNVLELLKKDVENKQFFPDLDFFSKNVFNYFENKNMKSKEKIRKLEFIKNFDSNQLMSKYQLSIHKKQSVCIVNDSNLKCLMDIVNINNKSKSYDSTNMHYREQQINLAYSLLNGQSSNNEVMVEKILNNLVNYENLIESEKHFLSYLWVKKMGGNSTINYILENHYFFVLERLILKHANNILKLNDEHKVQHYLKTNEEIIKLKISFDQAGYVYFKIKQALYELYCFSFCNINILKLRDSICISSSKE